MILVTGATGHIGNVLVRILVHQGKRVRAMVLPNDDLTLLKELDVEIVKGDVRDEESVAKAAKGVDLIYHLAAVISITPWKRKLLYEVNVKGTENVLKEAIKNNARMIYVSSVHAFAEPKAGAIIDERTPIDPKRTTGSYGKTKAIATLKVLEAARKGADVVIACPTGVIGPYDYKLSEMGRVILKFLGGKLKICIDGSFDFVDVRDVVDGLIKLSERGRKGEVYILGNRSVTMRKLMTILEEVSGVPAPKIYLPLHMAWIVSGVSTVFSALRNRETIFTPYAIYTLTRNYAFSHERAEKKLGYHPRPLEETLEDTVKWFRAQISFESLKGFRSAGLQSR
ncbi:NAD-dependent epimerase/dehydratase family protein [Thermotoga sp.]|uniref:NAD-dependent epimerase/dehydratase family protein n=1 Tax=Thermotoga sp. TaxID=28240 RepID=UPI0025FFF7DB|nr:NAD-dependent epimerase/dehydratase family protein [Thermotoga sp.]MCD6551196.1 NAD-dependent epimerase/dehydratase family protein [Thermotoga sp.]